LYSEIIIHKIINTSSGSKLLFCLLDWAKNDIVWISGRKVQGEPWKWHGRSVNNIVLGDWDRFQPSGETISYPGACISVLGAPKYTWDDYGCYSLQRYVCERPGKDYQLP